MPYISETLEQRVASEVIKQGQHLQAGSAVSQQVMSSFAMDMLFIQYDNTLQPENIFAKGSILVRK